MTHTSKAWLIFILSSAFYLFEFILQVAPSTMMNEIMHGFHVDAVGFGMLAACYFYGYSAMQIPAGILFDKHGPKKILTISLLTCSLGCILFALTTQIIVAGFARVLMGLGSAFSFIGILLLISKWFPPSKYAMLVGISQLIASIGAMFGESPFAELVALFGWEWVMLILGIGGLILTIAIWCIVEDAPKGQSLKPTNSTSNHGGRFEVKSLIMICRNPQTWWIAVYAFCSWTPVAVLGALWIIPYLQTLYQISPVHAGFASTMIWVGVGLGSPALGWLSEKMQNRKIPLAMMMILGFVICSIMTIDSRAISWPMMYIVLFLFGCSASGQTLSFALVKEINHKKLVGTASGFNNFAVVVGGALFQPLFGYLLTLFWDGKVDISGTPIYGIHAYQYAMIMLTVNYLVGLFAVIFCIKESYPKLASGQAHLSP